MVAFVEIVMCILLAAVLVLLCVLLYNYGKIVKTLRGLECFLSNHNDGNNAPVNDSTEIEGKSEPEVESEPEVGSEPEDDDDKNGEDAPSEPAAITPKPIKLAEEKTKRERVIEAISIRGEEVREEDLDRVMEELSVFFDDFANKDYFSDLSSNDYYRFVDLRKNPETRVVVLGDIHCDYLSLAAALLKLSVSDYDYFEKAYFVFLGDYLDRGDNLFEPLLLLMDLKRILGDRMIMLKGNHESIAYEEQNQELKSRVRPHESSDCLNRYCKSNLNFLKQFAVFYSTLPTYVYVKTDDRNVLLTHAAIPRDVFLEKICFTEADGSLGFNENVPVSERLTLRNRVFKDMIWGDPSKYEEKIQVEGRFEFGSKQFDRWVSRNHIGLLLRSHEEASFGYEAMFDGRLYTLFSTGGQKNPQTGYPNVEPAMGIVQNKSFDIENSFLYRIRKTDGSMLNVNLMTKQQMTKKQIEQYKLGNEFVCDKTKAKMIRGIFKKLCSDEAQQ